MEDILRIINSDPELKAKFETAVDNYCNSREGQLVLAWVTKRHNLTGDQMEALTFALEWADSHTNWISVKDELPKINHNDSEWEYSNDVIVSLKDGSIAVGRYERDNSTGEHYWVLYGVDKDLIVTHWMPKPVPPEHIADVGKMIGSSEIPNNQKGGEQ